MPLYDFNHIIKAFNKTAVFTPDKIAIDFILPLSRGFYKANKAGNIRFGDAFIPSVKE